MYIESAKTVNEMTLNELVKLTMLWTTGPCKRVTALDRSEEILLRGLNQRCWRKSSALIIMQVLIAKICSVRIEDLYLISGGSLDYGL